VRKSLIAFVGSVLVLGAVSPAFGAGPVLPPTIPDTPDNEYYYDLWFGAPPAGSTPSGRVVADSGFRTAPNGFPYANYGPNLDQNALFFGTPDNALEPMNSQDMRSLFGDDVCVTLKNTTRGGPCDLTPAAKYFAEYLLETVDSVGHCVGFAVAAAALFNGLLTPEDLGAHTLANQSQLTLDTQSELQRLWASQFFTPISKTSPADVVRTLVHTLKLGRVPSALIIRWPNAQGGLEGHGIMPFAVLNKGGGFYDIAVYDNNYPGQIRGVHVDMNANTWEYLVSVSPSSGPTIAAGNADTFTMGLMDVKKAVGKQLCPFCGSRVPTDFAAFGAFPASQNGKIDYGFRDLHGKPVPATRMNVLPALTSIASNQFTLPAAQIVRHNGYTMWIDTAANSRSVPLVAQLASNSGVRVVDWGRVNPGTRANITVSAGGASFAVTSNQAARPKLLQVFQQRERHYTVVASGGDVTAKGVSRYQRLDRADGLLMMGHSDNRKGSLSIRVTLETATGQAVFRAENVSWALGQHLAFDYDHWRSLDQTPTLWVRDAVTGANVRGIALVKVG